MRVLIVEDNTAKSERVRAALCASGAEGDLEIRTAGDVFTALECLREAEFSLLVLDIALPIRPGAQIAEDGGLQILEHLQSRTKHYNLPSHIVGVTERRDIFVKAEAFFSTRLLSLVYCDLASADWESSLTARVRHILSVGNGPALESYSTDLAIICALQMELDAVLKHLPWGWQQHHVPGDHTIYYRGRVRIGERVLSINAACASRMGMPATSALCMKLISHFRPATMAMVGIAAGAKARVKLGDVVVADCVWDWGSGKWALEEGKRRVFLPAPRQIPVDTGLRGKMQLLKGRTAWLSEIVAGWAVEMARSRIEVHIGPMASGAAVLADDETIKRLISDNRELTAVDMEAYAVYSAAEEASGLQPKTICIKGIVDFADGDKSDGWQAFGAYASASVLRFLVERL